MSDCVKALQTISFDTLDHSNLPVFCKVLKIAASSSDREIILIGLGVSDSFLVVSPVQAQRVIAMKAMAVFFFNHGCIWLIFYGKIIKNIEISKFFTIILI